MNLLERILFHPIGGQFREFVGLTTHIEPRDINLYRSLLPQPFELPDHPLVTIFLADYLWVSPWPFARYQEWSVLLKCRYAQQEEWYPITMPVTSGIAMRGGRHLGFPKYVVDRISLSEEGDNFRGSAIHQGTLQIELGFRPDHTRPLVAWEKELANNPSFFKGDCFCLVPPGIGPRIQKIKLVHVIPPIWAPRHGMLTVRVSPDEPWAGLLPEPGPFPGTYNHFIGGINLKAEKLA